MKYLFLLLIACGTDSLYDKATRGGDGTVYICNSGAMCGGGEEEWCWDGPRKDLELLLGADCRDIDIFDRVWPALTGCRYGCPLPGDGRGCNAHCGCFCP